MGTALSWALRASVIAACVTFALWDIDLEQLVVALQHYDLAKLGAVLTISFVPYLTMARRLAVLLRGIADEPTLGITLLASLLALGMNNLLPARLGELAKVVYLRQRCGASSGSLMGAVFWERFADVHALLCFSALTVLGFGRTDAFAPMAIAVAAGWAGILWARHHPRPFEWLIKRFPVEALARVGRDILRSLQRGLDWRVSAELVTWTIVTWTFYALHVYLVVVWIAEIDLGVLEVLTVFLGVSIGMVVPVSPGALGIYEAIFVLVLGWYGVPPEKALAAGLTAHMLQYLPTTVVGAVVLARADVSLRSFTSRRQND